METSAWCNLKLYLKYIFNFSSLDDRYKVLNLLTIDVLRLNHKDNLTRHNSPFHSKSSVAGSDTARQK